LSDPAAAPRGTLYLIPTLLGPAAPAVSLPLQVQARLHELRHFVAENAKSARHFLKAAAYPHALAQTLIGELNEHTPAAELPALLQPLLEGTDVGLLSEAGCPAVADPGSDLIALAHARGIRVAPLVGPSSLLLALMASGLNGQRFAFHGYLPVEKAAREAALRALERESRAQRCTQLVIETPYRNARLFEALLSVCQPDTRLCIAADLTLDTEYVRTLTLGQWRGEKVDLDRRPAVFVLQAT
jgi:16S rRNA (cytidine1402-2'-O)-methyltransferase